MVPFLATSNTIAGPSNINVCTGTSPGVLNASNYAYTGTTVNPSIVYQWQSSTDGISFTDIAGATTEDYTPPTQTTTTSNIVIYYRRRVTAAIPSACVFFTAAVKITTSPVGVLANPTISGPSSVCPTSNQTYSCSVVTNAAIYNWVVPAGWIIVSGAGTTTINVLSGSSAQSGNVSVTATNGCATSGSVSYAVAITQPVIWNGTSFNASENNINRPIIFNGNYTSPLNTIIAACDCTVNGTAVVTLTSGSSMTLQNEIKVNSLATITFQNNAPLVQINDGPLNSGKITVNRNSSLLQRLDYTLWSSPVANQNILAFSPLTFNVGPSNVRFYTYNTNLNLYEKINPGATNFATGKGYLIRMPNNHPTTPTVWNGVFTGAPNNGIITVPVVNISATQWFNTVGNPYPSPISLTSFVAANTANINNTIRFWRKTNTVTTNTGYSTWNSGIFTAGPNFNTSADPLGVLQTGQGFMVEAKSGATSIVFNNAMRIVNTANQFFRASASTKDTKATSKSGFVWLNLIGTSDQNSQMAVGYRENASNNEDEFDSTRFNDSQISISSVINNGEYVIESRAPLNNENQSDVVPLQVRVPSNTAFVIEMDHATGFLNDANTTVFLKDKTNSLLIDLKQSGYSFKSNSGLVADRFELLINKKGAVLKDEASTSFSVFKDNNEFVMNAGLNAIYSVKVYDLLGRLYFEESNLNTKELRFDATGSSNQVLIFKTVFTNGEEVIKKVIN